MHENKWARLRESRKCRAQVTQPGPHIFMHGKSIELHINKSKQTNLVLRSRSSMFCPEVPVTLVPPTENMYGFVADFIVG